MDMILLGITVVSLIVALVMSATAWRLMRDEKQRAAARVAALSIAADESPREDRRFIETPFPEKPVAVKAPWASPQLADLPLTPPAAPVARVAPAAPVSRVSSVSPASSASARAVSGELRRDLAGAASGREGGPTSPATVTHSTGFLGASEIERDNGSRQKTLAFAALVLFAVLAGGLMWIMSGPEGTSAAAVGPNSPLELVSLTHARDNDPSTGLRAGKLVVSGLVRNPENGKPIERLSAVVFLFDRAGTFVTSSRASVDFLKLGAGDETPFVVSLDAPTTVARYRVSFRTEDGIVPHVDRRSAPDSVNSQESAVRSQVVSQQ